MTEKSKSGKSKSEESSRTGACSAPIPPLPLPSAELLAGSFPASLAGAAGAPAEERAAELAEAREELRAVARALLGKTRPPAAPGLAVMASSGWLGLEVPDALGGADATFAEVAVIAQELGRAAACGAYLGAIVGGVGTLRALVPSPGRDDLLRRAVTGDALPVAVLAGGGSAGGPDSGGVPFWLTTAPASGIPGVRGAPGGQRLRGAAAFVPDAARATTLLVLARAVDDGAPVIIALDPHAAGVVIEPQPVLDETRELAVVRAEGADVGAASVWRFAGDPRAAVRRLLDRAAVAVACDSLGVSEAMLEATVAYARAREQFGRPIGSFQAVKHACADLLVRVSVARELVTAAVTALAGDAASTSPVSTSPVSTSPVSTSPAGTGAVGPSPVGTGAVDASTAASMAKAYACDAAVEVAGKAMQLHGGIGYTWESGIHVYLKRAALNRSLFGSPAAHRRRIAARYR
jgi:alkylation response protein AidB-like acyl-CoA dehydrogenase